MDPLTIAFVCQKGRLETEAVLLAASLRRHFPPQTRLMAAHPERHGALGRDTLLAFEQMNVEVAAIQNPLRASYPIGHKLAALALLQQFPLGVFLDTDILAMAPPGPLPETLAAVPASRQHCRPAEWRYLYEKFSLPVPPEDFPVLADGARGVPYFNSGMITVPGSQAERLASSWIDTALRIDTDPSVGRHIKSPWLDQVSLPIAATRAGLAITPLDSRWNFPSWIWRIGDRPPPVFFHYQKIARLRREHATLAAARETATAVPGLLPELSASPKTVGDWFRTIAARAGSP